MRKKKEEITVSVAAKICGCSVVAVRQWIINGKIKARRPLGGIWLIDKESLEPMISPAKLRNPRGKRK